MAAPPAAAVDVCGKNGKGHPGAALPVRLDQAEYEALQRDIQLWVKAQRLAAKQCRRQEVRKVSVKKAPKVSQLKLEEPRLQQRTTSTNAPVNVCVYKVTDQAGDLWANFKDTDAKLFQIQMEHDARL